MYMEEKKEYCYESICQRGRNASFTAGILLLMVCLKIAFLLFLFERWRAWVFFVLNIVLLAIFFTSTNPSSSSTSNQSQEAKIYSMSEEEMKKKRCNSRLSMNEVEAKKRRNESEGKLAEEELQVEEHKNAEPLKLSKEELNERVEAFIAMFRQHLASDARKGRENRFYVERKQADIRRKKPINLSSDGVNCFVLKVQG